jgi:Alternative complex III, ActD subunit
VRREEGIYGLMAEFRTREELLNAAERSYAEGYRSMDAYSPFPVEGLAKAIGRRWTAVPLIVLISGMIGGLGGYFMEWYAAVVDYPINVGGRPLHSWPAFIPITFELTVLCASLSAIIGMLALNRLPQPYHPVFNVPEFRRASVDRFFLCIESSDPKFEPGGTRAFLEKLKPEQISEVTP